VLNENKTPGQEAAVTKSRLEVGFALRMGDCDRLADIPGKPTENPVFAFNAGALRLVNRKQCIELSRLSLSYSQATKKKKSGGSVGRRPTHQARDWTSLQPAFLPHDTP